MDILIVFECFDALKPDKKLKEVKLSFTIVKPQCGEQQQKHDAYDMKCFPHGVVLIINNKEFVRQADFKIVSIKLNQCCKLKRSWIYYSVILIVT